MVQESVLLYFYLGKKFICVDPVGSSFGYPPLGIAQVPQSYRERWKTLVNEGFIEDITERKWYMTVSRSS